MLRREPLPSQKYGSIDRGNLSSTISSMAGAIKTTPPDSPLWQQHFLHLQRKTLRLRDKSHPTSQRQSHSLRTGCLRSTSVLTSFDATPLQASLPVHHLNLYQARPDLDMTFLVYPPACATIHPLGHPPTGRPPQSKRGERTWHMGSEDLSAVYPGQVTSSACVSSTIKRNSTFFRGLNVIPGKNVAKVVCTRQSFA